MRHEGVAIFILNTTSQKLLAMFTQGPNQVKNFALWLQSLQASLGPIKKKENLQPDWPRRKSNFCGEIHCNVKRCRRQNKHRK